MSTYTCTYSAIATSVSEAALAAAWALVPKPSELVSVFGLAFVSDTVTPGAPVTRTLVYESSPGQILPDPDPAELLTGYMTGLFSTALATIVVASAVVVT